MEMNYVVAVDPDGAMYVKVTSPAGRTRYGAVLTNDGAPVDGESEDPDGVILREVLFVDDGKVSFGFPSQFLWDETMRALELATRGLLEEQ